MANPADTESALARVYATAMFDLAGKQGQVDELLAELNALDALLEKNTDFQLFFLNPALDAQARAASIERMFRGRMSDLLVDSLQVLNRKGRLSLFRSVADVYRHIHQDKQGHVEVFVVTAAPLTGDTRARLRQILADHTGREPDLIERIDEAVLGGLVVYVGDQKLDSSIGFRLRTLSRFLHDRAMQELYHGRSDAA